MNSSTKSRWVSFGSAKPAASRLLLTVVFLVLVAKVPAQVVTFYVPSTAEYGVRYTASASGVHRFTIASGAWSPWEAGPWKTMFHIWKNQAVQYAPDPNYPGRWGPVFSGSIALGDGGYQSTFAEAENIGRGRFVEIDLNQNDYVTLLTPDHLGYYSGNAGGILLNISLPRTTVSVGGRVLNAANGFPESNVGISLANGQTFSGPDCAFLLVYSSSFSSAILTASKNGYATSSFEVHVADAAVLVNVGDILLYRSSTNPVVTSVKARYEGIFLSGVSLVNEYTANVDWSGGVPGAVEVYVNGTLNRVASASATGASASVDMALGFFGSLTLGANKLGVVAVSGSGARSERFEQTVRVIPMPFFLREQALLAPFEFIPGNDPGLSFSFEIPNKDYLSEMNLPFINLFGMNLSIVGGLDYSMNSGKWSLYGGAGTKADKTPGFLPKMLAGPVSIDFDVKLKAEGVASQTRGLVVGAAGIEISAEVEKELFDLLLSDAVGAPWLRVLDPLKAVGIDPNSLQRIKFFGEVNADIPLMIQFDPPPVQFTGALGVGLGIKAAYEPDFIIAKGSIYAGGTVSGEWSLPTFAWNKISGEVYCGVSFTAFLVKIVDEKFILLHYERDFAGSGLGRWAATGKGFWVAIPLQSGPVCPADRSYLQAGLERFVAYDLPTQTKAKASSSPAVSESFRLIGQAPVSGSVMAGLSSGAGAKSSALGCGTNQVDWTLVQNAFPNSQPSLAGRSNELMLLYVADNGSSNALQFTDIKWTRWDGTNWSTPAAIRTNTQAEFGPQVKYDGNGDAIAVWERVADLNFTNVDLTAMAAQMEIVWSRWSRTNAAWSEPVALTANSVLDHAPLLCGPMSDGSVLAVWTQNQLNLLMGTNGAGADRVLRATWNAATRTWATPQSMVSGLKYRLSQSLAGADGHSVYAWTKDADGVLTNDTDQEVFYCEWTNGVWSATKQLTTNTVADKNVRVAVATNGDAYLVWQSGTNLVMSRNFSTNFTLVRSDSQTAGFADYGLTLGPNGNLVLLWREMSTNGSDAHYMVYDPASDTWSKDMLLCADSPLERSFAPVWDDVGNLTVAYNKVQIVYTNKTVTLDGGGTVTITNVPQPGRVDLVVTKRALVKDLALLAGDFTVQGVNWLPGDPLTLTALVRNAGDVAVSNVVVAFYDGNSTNGGVLITNVAVSGWLEGAGTNTASALWVVPEPATNHVLYAVADPAGAVTEFNEANNTQSLSIGGTDLAVSLVSQSAETNGALRVIAQVQNLGAPTATNTILVIRRNGETVILATNGVPALEPGRLAQVALDLPPGTQPAGEVIYQLSADDTHVVSDVNTNNNTTRFAVNLWIDSDSDGIPDNWMMQYFGHAAGQAGDLSRAQDDADGDGVSNLAEYRAGTNPTNALSYLRIESISVAGTNGVQVAWGSASNHLYSVLRASVLAANGATFTNLAEHILSTPPENVFFDTTATNDSRFFYRIKVE